MNLRMYTHTDIHTYVSINLLAFTNRLVHPFQGFFGLNKIFPMYALFILHTLSPHPHPPRLTPATP